MGNRADQTRLSGVILLKCTVVSVHAVQAYPGSRGTAPVILNLGTKQKWVVDFTLRPLYSRVRTSAPNVLLQWR